MSITRILFGFDARALISQVNTLESNQSIFKLKLQELTIMSKKTQDDFAKEIKRMDDATSDGAKAVDAIGRRITKLEEAINTAGLTREQEALLLAQTSGVADNISKLSEALKAMATEPDDTVPIEPPPPLDPVDPDSDTNKPA